MSCSSTCNCSSATGAAWEQGEKLYRHAKRVIDLLEETPAAVRGKEAA
ncbi:MAG: hypothetical protein O2979_10805 [Proteobacteria bacterium]|nr:hypothetical protein [Pseudomonadota bacterium]